MLERGKRISVRSRLGVHDREILVRQRIAHIDVDRQPVLLDGTLAIAHPVQQIAEVVVQARLPQAHADGIAVGRRGFRITTERTKRKREIGEEGGRATDMQRRAYVINGIVVVSGQVARDTEHMQRVRMTRLTRQHRTKQPRRAGRIAGLQMAHGIHEKRGAFSGAPDGTPGESNR
nr:hypothetical protein [Burkholderia territorii]